MKQLHLERVAFVGAACVGGVRGVRNEAMVFALTLAAEFQQCVQTLVEGSFMVGLVAEVEGKADFRAVARVVVAEAVFLEGTGAEAEPAVRG